MLICLGCAKKKTDFEQELSIEHLVRSELQTLKISLDIPQKHTVFKNNDSIVIDLNPDERTIRQFSVAKLPPTIQKDKYKESVYFKNGATLNYYNYKATGGSGGIEYVLEGILKFEEELFLISVTDQKEYGKGNPEFYLK